MRTLLNFLLIFLMVPAQLSAQGLPEGLFIGARAPDFRGIDQFGRTIHLREQAKKNPVVLVFYRGNWCPHCMRLLTRIQDSFPFFTQKSVSIIAISPESEESLAKTMEKTKAGFSLLRDTGLFIAKKYDLAYVVSENQLTRYRNGGIDLNKINAPNPPLLSVPTVFIIGKDYTITYRFFDPEHKKRINVNDILTQF
jgi:peroxiredoxin